jgi:hypothetical protein
MSDSQPGGIDHEAQDKVDQKPKGKGYLLLVLLFYLCFYLGLYTLFSIVIRIVIGGPVSMGLITGSGFWFGMLFAAAAFIPLIVWHRSVASRILALFDDYVIALFQDYVTIPLALVGAVILSGNLAANLWYAFLWLIHFAIRYGLFLPVFVLFIIGVIATSVLAFALRSRNRIVYGMIEMLVGVVGVVYSVYSIILEPYLKGTLDSLLNGISSYLILQLLTAMYIIVRGLTNIEDGFGKGKLTLLDFLTESAFRLGNFWRSHLPTRR